MAASPDWSLIESFLPPAIEMALFSLGHPRSCASQRRPPVPIATGYF